MHKRNIHIVQYTSITMIVITVVYLLSSALLYFLTDNLIINKLPSLFIAIITGYIYIKQKLAPIENELDEAVDILSNRQRENEKSYDLKILTIQTVQHINELNEENLNQRERIEELNVELGQAQRLQEVEMLRMELLETQKELALIRQSLDEANTIKSEFLSNISHELRTPMNGIIGMTELLMDTPLTHEQSSFLEIVKNSGYHLLSLINNVLDFSYIESGDLEIEAMEFNIKSTLKNLVSVITIKAEEKGLHFFYSIDSTVPDFIKSDPGRIRQLLNNILSNAVKFTSKGKITFECTFVEENTVPTIRFTIKDTGIGIPEEYQQKLFEKFSQADSSYTRSFGGTGIGLALCYELVNLMHGTISIESREDKGTEVVIELPFCKTDKESKKIDDIDIKDLKILILDDNKNNLNIYHNIFSSLDLNFDLYSSGKETINGMEAAKTNGIPYDIAFVDMQMPEMSGLDVGNLIREKEGLHDTSLILLSSIAKKGDAKVSKNIGFDAFLSKPINKSDIVDCLKLIQAHKIEDSTGEKELITVHTIRENRILTKRILLTEDNRTNVIIATGILESLGYKYAVAHDGVEALERLEEEHFDLILMDLEMPKLNGIDTTKIIRSSTSKPFSSLPIIAMTANSNPGIIKECKTAGMNDSIVKPISSRLIDKVLQKWLK